MCLLHGGFWEKNAPIDNLRMEKGGKYKVIIMEKNNRKGVYRMAAPFWARAWD